MAASTDSGSVTRRPLPIFAEIRRAQDAGYEQELRRALETLRGRTPRWLRLGAAVEGADSFFDAVAQALKELRGGAGGAAVSVVSLRSGCRDFAGAEGGGGSWLEASLRARGQKLRKYVRRVGNVASVAGEKAVRGSLEVEGKIIGEQHGVGLGVLELAEGLVTEQAVGDGRTGAVVRVAKYGGHYVPLLSSIEKDVRKKKEVPHDEVYGRDIQEDLHTTTDRKCRYSATHLVEEYCEPQLASIDKDVKKKKADQGTNFGRSLEEVVDITAGRKNLEEEHCLTLFHSIEKKKKKKMKFSHGELYGRTVKENVHVTTDRKRMHSAFSLVQVYCEPTLDCIGEVVKKKKKMSDQWEIYEIADMTADRKCSHSTSSLEEEYFDPLIVSADKIVKKKKKRKDHNVEEVVDLTALRKPLVEENRVPQLVSIMKDVKKKIEQGEIYGRDVEDIVDLTLEEDCCEPLLASIDKPVKKRNKKFDHWKIYGREVEMSVDLTAHTKRMNSVLPLAKYTAGRKNLEEEQCLSLFPSIEKKKKKFSHGNLYGGDVKENVHMTMDTKRRYSATPLVEEYCETTLACIEGVVKKKKKKKTDEGDIYRQDVVEIADMTANRKCSHLSSPSLEEYFEPPFASADKIVKKKKKQIHPGMINDRDVKEVEYMTANSKRRHLTLPMVEECFQPLIARINKDVKKYDDVDQGKSYDSNVDEVVWRSTDMTLLEEEHCLLLFPGIEENVKKKKKVPHGEVYGRNIEEVIHLTAHRKHSHLASPLKEEYCEPLLTNIDNDVEKKVDRGKIYGHDVEEVVELTAERKPLMEEKSVLQLVGIMKDVKKKQKVDQGDIYGRDVEDIVDLTLEEEHCVSLLASIDKDSKKKKKKKKKNVDQGCHIHEDVDPTTDSKCILEEVTVTDGAEVPTINDNVELIGDPLDGPGQDVLVKMAKCIVLSDQSFPFRKLMHFFSTERARKAINTLSRLGISLTSMAAILSGAGVDAPQVFTDLYHLWVDERGQKAHYLQNLESRGVKLCSVSSILWFSGSGACKAFLDLYDMCFNPKGNPTRYLAILEKEKLKFTSVTSILSRSGVRGPKAFKELFNLWFDEEGKKTQYLTTLEKERINLSTMCSILSGARYKAPEAFVKLYNLWFNKQGAKSRYLISLEKQGIHLTRISSILRGVGSRAPEVFVKLYDLWLDVRGNKTRYLQTLEEWGINLTRVSSILCGAGSRAPESFIALYNLWFDRQGNKTQYLTALEMRGINLSSVSSNLSGAGRNAAKAFIELFNFWLDGQVR